MGKLHPPQEKLFLSLLYGIAKWRWAFRVQKKSCQGWVCVCVRCGILFVFICVCKCLHEFSPSFVNDALLQVKIEPISPKPSCQYRLENFCFATREKVFPPRAITMSKQPWVTRESRGERRTDGAEEWNWEPGNYFHSESVPLKKKNKNRN